MKKSAKQLREERALIAKEIARIRDEGKAIDADGKFTEAWTKANADYDAMTRDIGMAERVESVEAEQSKTIGDPDAGRAAIRQPNSDGATITDEHKALALSAWFASDTEEGISDEQAQACKLLGFNPNAKSLTIPLFNSHQYSRLQRRFQKTHHSRHDPDEFGATLGTSPLSGAGAVVTPPSLIRSLEVNMLAFGGMRQVADSIRTSTGEPITWPTADDTSNTGAQVGEAGSGTGSYTSQPTFGGVVWNAYKFTSKFLKLNHELLRDSVIDLPTVLGAMLGERLSRITNTKFTTGTGAATCKGIVTAATSYSAASATAIAADDIVKLYHAVDPAYRAGFQWMSHDAIALQIRLLKDGNGRPLFMSYESLGEPDRLLGKPWTINQDMDSTMSSGTKTLLGGDLSSYKIRTVGAVRMVRLNELFAETDQVGFGAFIEEDGNLLTSATARVKYLAH